MRYTKRDKAEELASVVKRERRELAGLEKDFAAAKLKWTERHIGCLQSAAMLSASPQTYARGAEGVFQEFELQLAADAKRAIAERDGLLGELPAQVREVKERIDKRLGILASAFSSWSSKIVDEKEGTSKSQIAGGLDQELEQARHQASGMSDVAELISFIASWTERIESMDDVSCGLLRLDVAVTAALAVE